MEIVNCDFVGFYSYAPDITVPKYSDDNTQTVETNIECVICKKSLLESPYDILLDNTQISELTDLTVGKCGHMFHSYCIDKWFDSLQYNETRCCPLDKVEWHEARKIDTTTNLIINKCKNKYKKYSK